MSQIKPELMSQIKLEPGTNARILMTITGLVSDTWRVNGLDLGAGAE